MVNLAAAIDGVIGVIGKIGEISDEVDNVLDEVTSYLSGETYTNAIIWPNNPWGEAAATTLNATLGIILVFSESAKDNLSAFISHLARLDLPS